MTELTRNQIEALRIYATTFDRPIKDVPAYEMLMAAKAEQLFKNGLLDAKVLESLCTLATKALDLTAALLPDIAAIATRDAARTQGKWEQYEHSPKHIHDGMTLQMPIAECRKEADADFIAHASEDIPSLLSEVARLSAALAEAEKRGYDAAKEQAMQQVRHDCRACSGTGHADAETECEYCGRPMRSIAAMVRP